MDTDNRFVMTAWRVMDELSRAAQIEDALSNCIDIMCDTLSCRSGSLWMKNDQDDRLYIVACKGSNDVTGISTRYTDSFVAETAQSGNSRIIADTSKEPLIISDPDFNILYGRNVMLIPLKTPRGIYGCLQLNDSTAGFTEDDMRLCQNVAAMMALDIEDKGFVFRPAENRVPLISLRDVVKEFANGEEVRRVLKDIDLDVYEGELLVVLGESGCGKSTMLNIIGGMDQMTSGQLLVEGRDFSHPTEQQLTEYRRDYIGFIFQSYNLMPNLTALENVEFIAEISDHPLNSSTALKLVGMDDRQDRYPSVLSGGQQQRVCIARAFVKNPKIILADEPTAALDVKTGQEVLKVLQEIVKKGTTVIMVTHNIEIAKMANRVIRLKEGTVYSIRVNLNPMKAEEITW